LNSLSGRRAIRFDTDFSTVIVLDDTVLQHLNARYGIHYPVHFPSLWLNRSGTKAVVKWSAGWVGGTLFFSKEENGQWKAEEVSRWIT
jgi:hypothetical protein